MPRNYIQVKPIADLENELEYKFKNKDLLRQSLTHASAISENHPMAFNRDLSTLAFVGDSVLKYAVARYLFQNGQNQVADDCDELHKGTQTVIPNDILADIAREKLHLEEYIIRGNAHKTPSRKMHASCFEAILGAIALDCGLDHQEVIFRVVERLCADRYENLLKPIAKFRFLAASHDDDDEETVNVTQSLWNYMQCNASGMPPYKITLRPPERTRLQKLGLCVLWLLVIYGFFCIVQNTIGFMRFPLSNSSETERDGF